MLMLACLYLDVGVEIGTYELPHMSCHIAPHTDRLLVRTGWTRKQNRRAHTAKRVECYNITQLSIFYLCLFCALSQHANSTSSSNPNILVWCVLFFFLSFDISCSEPISCWFLWHGLVIASRQQLMIPYTTKVSIQVMMHQSGAYLGFYQLPCWTRRCQSGPHIHCPTQWSEMPRWTQTHRETAKNHVWWVSGVRWERLLVLCSDE